MEQLKARLREKRRLPIAVFSTPAADAVVARAGLSLVDLLRPVALVNNLNVPMRVGEHSMRVQEVQLALYPGPSMFQPAPEAIDERLHGVLELESQRHAQLTPSGNIIQHVQREAPEAVNPWYAAYHAEFLRLLQFTDHETLDHPVAGLFCMPADAGAPLQVADKLLQPEQQLPLMASESMVPFRDHVIAKHFVLVQDTTCMDEGRALQNLATLSNTYGAANCSILKLYAGSPAGSGGAAAGADALPPAAFQTCRHACMPKGGAGEPLSRLQEPPGGLGAGLTHDDMAAAGQLLRGFTERSVLPKLEERIARLNLSITAARKGLKNSLKRLWKGAAGETGPVQETPYPWHSVEGQMRCLADLAFMLGQYEFAVAHYRLAAQDYLAAPNSKWYAGAEEMIGVCSILTADASVDPVKYLNRAFEHYSKLRGRQGRMLATRAMMTAAAYQAALGRHLTANGSLMRAHFEEETGRAALLLEAAAYELMRCNPPCARKAAFHLVLAGLRYHAAKQKRLAVHCYMQVTELYSSSSWQHINEHLHEVLGRQCAELADGPGMLRHQTALLECAHRPPANQQHYLNQFLETVKAQGVTGAIPNLPLPAVVNDTVAVHHADMRCYASSTAAAAAAGKPAGSGSSDAAAGSPTAVWAQLEQLLAGGDMPSTNWLEGAKQVHDGEEFNTVAAGEDVGVQVTFKNPLQVKLSLSRVRLHVQFTPADKAAPGAGAPAALPADAGGGMGGAAVSAEDVLVMESQFSLHPGEVLSERLSVRPLAAGWLRVLGVSWLLADTAEGYVAFDIKGRKRKRPKGDRPSQQKHYPPSRRLLFHVLKGMPRLELSIAGLPTAAAVGELLRVQVTLRNVGLLAARKLKAAVSSPLVALGAAAPAAAAAAAGDSTDVWTALQSGTDVLTLARQKGMHRRHKSSGAALVGAGRDKQHAAAAGAHTVAPAAPPPAAAHLEQGTGSSGSSGLHSDHLPHIHSSPSIPAVAAAASAAAGSSGREPRAAASGLSHAAAAAAVGAAAGAEGDGWAVDGSTTAVGVFDFADPELVLEPGESVSVPMWLHQREPGRFEFECVWFCEPQVLVSAAMRYRVLLSHHVLSVSPLLELSPAASPSAADLTSYTLRLESTYSKEAPRGQLHLQQISCLTSGLDGGWRLMPFSSGSNAAAATAATPAAPAAALQQSLTPNISMSAGEGSMHYLQLLSPASAAAAAAAAAAGSRGGSSAGQPVPLQAGPLRFFYSRGRRAGPGVLPGLLQQQQQPGSSGSTPTAAAAVAVGLRGMALEHKQSALVAEPPVDLLVLWRFQPAAAAAAAGGQGGASGLPLSQSQQQQLQQQRVGLLTFYDLCAAQRLNPVRMTLEGPAAAAAAPGQAVSTSSSSNKGGVKHDFRAASMCVIPLRLKLRNCGVVAVTVTVRAATDAWQQGLSSEHAWFCAPSVPGAKHPGLLGPVQSQPHGSPMQQQPPAAAAAGMPAGAGAGGGGGAAQQGYMQQQQGRFLGAGPLASAAGAGPGLPQQGAGAAAAAGGFAPAGYSSGPPPPPAGSAADAGLPPKSRTPPTSTSGGLSVLGPAAAAAADTLGLSGFNLGALAGGLASGLRFPSPGGTGASSDAGSASSSVHGGSIMQQGQPVTAAAAGAAGVGSAGVGVSEFPATAIAVASSGVPPARGGMSAQQGPLSAAAAAAAPGGLLNPQQQPGVQGVQQRNPGSHMSQQQQQQQQEVQAGLPPGPDYVWCGVTRVTLESLLPGSSADVVLQVAVFRPGVYVIDDYVVDWQVCGPPAAAAAAGEGLVAVHGGAGSSSSSRRRQGSKMGEPAVLRVEAV